MHEIRTVPMTPQDHFNLLITVGLEYARNGEVNLARSNMDVARRYATDNRIHFPEDVMAATVEYAAFMTRQAKKAGKWKSPELDERHYEDVLNHGKYSPPESLPQIMKQRWMRRHTRELSEFGDVA